MPAIFMFRPLAKHLFPCLALALATAGWALTDQTPRDERISAPKSASAPASAGDGGQMNSPVESGDKSPHSKNTTTAAARIVTDGRARVMVIEVREVIDSPVLYVLRRGLKEAEEKKINVVVLDMETPGGVAGTALEMMEALDKYSGHTITYINTEAISAGAFIAAATDEIWFAPKGVIGAAAAVSGDGQDIPETMRLKINSFLRAKIRAATEAHPYRGQVLSAMIDKDYELKLDGQVLKPKGELLSLTATEAMTAYGTPPRVLLAAGVAADVDDLLTQKFGAANFESERLEVTWSERLAQWLNLIKPILLSLGMLALFIEFKTPGFGMFGIAGIVLLAIVFLSSYVAGLSGHEPMLLFALGFVLILVELIFFPGLIIPALTGLVMMLGSLVWAMADLWPNEPISVAWSSDVLVAPVMNLALGLLLTALFAVALVKFIPRGWFWDKLVLSSSIGAAAQIAGMSAEQAARIGTIVGRRALVTTPLRPFGQIEIDGRRYEASVSVGTVGRGASVIVTRRTDFGIEVEPAPDGVSAAAATAAATTADAADDAAGAAADAADGAAQTRNPGEPEGVA
jgi:membrane-bound serine protease (ClpP class)